MKKIGLICLLLVLLVGCQKPLATKPSGIYECKLPMLDNQVVEMKIEGNKAYYDGKEDEIKLVDEKTNKYQFINYHLVFFYFNPQDNSLSFSSVAGTVDDQVQCHIKKYR